jgi:N-acetylglutamate synthase-like GNAT family acetyltransferase
LSIEQSHDAIVIAAFLDQAKTAAPVNSTGDQCFLIAYWGNDPVGIAGVETEVDTALMCPLFVVESMRRRGVGAGLVQAARVAAHTRGARMLYTMVSTSLTSYFKRLGFTSANSDELFKTFSRASQPNSSGNTTICDTVCLDISRDGLIER